MESWESILQVLDEVSSGSGTLAQAIVQQNEGNLTASGLDAETYVLVRFAALVALDAPLESYAAVMEMAAQAGVTAEQAAGVLIALAPVAGGPRVTSAAAKVQQAFAAML